MSHHRNSVIVARRLLPIFAASVAAMFSLLVPSAFAISVAPAEIRPSEQAAPSTPTNCAVSLGRFFGLLVAYVRWTDTSDNEDGFIVEHRCQGQVRTSVCSANSTGAIMNLRRGMNKYRVKAFNSDGESGWSNWGNLRF